MDWTFKMDLPKLEIPGFASTDWMMTIPSGCEDEDGTWLPGPPLGYIKRFIRRNAFPDAPDGKTGAANAIIISTLDIEANPEPKQLVALIRARFEIVEMSLRDLFKQKGVEFPT